MGLYDSVMTTCPACGVEFEIQSKGGDCAMDVYGAADVPLAVAAAVKGKLLSCDACGAGFSVASDVPDRVAVTLDPYDGCVHDWAFAADLPPDWWTLPDFEVPHLACSKCGELKGVKPAEGWEAEDATHDDPRSTAGGED